MKGVILAAGLGTRMRPLTYRRPKPLVPVLDRPMIEHIVAGAADAGVTELLVVVGYRADMIQEALGDGSRFGLQIFYELQEKPAGTGDATLLAEGFVEGQAFFLSWGDIIISPVNYANVGRVWRENEQDLLLTLNYVEDPYEGAAVYVEEGRVTKIIEKPPKGTSTTNYNNAGVFVMPAEILEATKEIEVSARGERELPDAIQLVLSRGAFVRGVPIEGCWSDVARPAEVIRHNGALLGDREYTDGAIQAESACIGDGAELTAPYIVAEGASVGNGCRVGPGAYALEGAVLGEGCSVSNSLLLARAGLGEGCRLEWAVVEEDHAVPAGTQAIGTAEEPVFLGSDEE